MLSIASFLIAHAIPQAAMILDIYLGNGDSERRANNWFQVDTELVVVIVMGVFLVFDALALSLIFQLLFFHIKLQREGLSTYQFIVRDNQQRREKAKLEEEREQRRTEEMAKSQGSIRYLQLKWGGQLEKTCGLACCDPLPLEQQPSSTNNDSTDDVEASHNNNTNE